MILVALEGNFQQDFAHSSIHCFAAILSRYDRLRPVILCFRVLVAMLLKLWLIIFCIVI